jgi:hypothetical protein
LFVRSRTYPRIDRVALATLFEALNQLSESSAQETTYATWAEPPLSCPSKPPSPVGPAVPE